MGIVLMYHRVATLPRDPYGLAVSPENFRAHVDHLAQLGSAVPLGQIREPGARHHVAITFDDGYVDNATFAAPLVAAAGLPATWFITSQRLAGQRFWWDRLADGVLGATRDSVDVEIDGRTYWLDLRNATARTTALRFLHRKLRPLPPDLLDATVDAAVGRLGAAEGSSLDLTMTVDQLRQLASLPRQEIGAHTRTHLQLRDQAVKLQRDEVLGSVTDLSDLLGHAVQQFAYPFGSESAVGTVAPRLVAEAGCDIAVTTRSGLVGARSDRYVLPRMAVGDWSAEEFGARLRDAFASW